MTRQFINVTLILIISIININSQNVVVELTLQQKQMMLDLHNSIRQDCANGLYGIDGPQYSSDMVYLFWDKGLEDTAKVRASYCYFGSFGGRQALQADFDANKQNISFIEPLSGYTVGENVALFAQNPPVTNYDEAIFTNGISAWASEGELYDWGNNICYADTCQNWKQVCSGPTRYVGCAFAECYDGIAGASLDIYRNGGMVLVCNYYPGVNYGGYPFQAATTNDCIGCQNWDVNICENNVCTGGKSRYWLASNLTNTTIDQCQDGLNRTMDPCTTIDPTKSPTSSNPTISTDSPVTNSPTTTRQPSPRPTLFGFTNAPTTNTRAPAISGFTLIPSPGPAQTQTTSRPTETPTVVVTRNSTQTPITRTNKPINEMFNINIHNKYIIYGNNNNILNNNYFNKNIKSNDIIQCACFDIIDISNSNNKCYINYMGGKIIKIYNSNDILKYEYIIDYDYNNCKCYKNNKLIIHELSIPNIVFNVCLNQLNKIKINPCSTNANIIAIKSLNNISYILKGKKGIVIQIITIIILLIIGVLFYIISKCLIKKCFDGSKYTLINEESSSNCSHNDIMT